jgi:3',5'-cyclic AMP phosphodiesterase CpdA
MRIYFMPSVNAAATGFLILTLSIIFLDIMLKSSSVQATAGGGDPVSRFNFAAVGDWGCTQDAQDTLNNIIKKDPELVIGLGDYSYNTTADCWLDITEQINDRMKIAIGNHEHIIYRPTFGNGSYMSPSLLNEYMRHFSLTDQYYSFDYQNVHFLVMSSEVPFDIGSEQYDFVKDDLEKASTNSSIRWIVANFHRPIYTALDEHLPNVSFRDIYHPIFDQYGVDLVLQGHVHNYQRSYPLEYNPSDSSNPIVTTNEKTNYAEPQAPIFVIVGTGGVGFSQLSNRSSFNVYQTVGSYGFLNIDITNDGMTMKATFYTNEDDKDNSRTIKDQFAINKIK